MGIEGAPADEGGEIVGGRRARGEEDTRGERQVFQPFETRRQALAGRGSPPGSSPGRRTVKRTPEPCRGRAEPAGTAVFFLIESRRVPDRHAGEVRSIRIRITDARHDP